MNTHVYVAVYIIFQATNIGLAFTFGENNMFCMIGLHIDQYDMY